jgi:predicted dehydrogenase
MNPPPSPTPLRVGVAGLHHDHAWSLLASAADHPGIRLVSAADPSPRLRERFAQLHGLPATDDYETVLGDPSLDAVFLFADNRTSADLAVAAASRGLHVLVEKPMAADLDGASRMLEATRTHGVRLMINWPYAWWPALRHAVTVARDGLIGRIWHVRYRGCHRGPENVGCSPEFTAWLFDHRRNGGGVLVDYCGYGANLAAVLLGEPRSVTGFTATLTRRDFPVEDNATLIVRYPDAMATLEGSWSQIGSFTTYVTVLHGTSGSLLVEPYAAGRLLHATVDHPDGVPLDIPALPPEDAEPVAHFVSCLREGRPFHPLCDAVHGWQAQRILEAGAAAAWHHRETDVPPGPGPGAVTAPG